MFRTRESSNAIVSATLYSVRRTIPALARSAQFTSQPSFKALGTRRYREQRERRNVRVASRLSCAFATRMARCALQFPLLAVVCDGFAVGRRSIWHDGRSRALSNCCSWVRGRAAGIGALLHGWRRYDWSFGMVGAAVVGVVLRWSVVLEVHARCSSRVASLAGTARCPRPRRCFGGEQCLCPRAVALLRFALHCGRCAAVAVQCEFCKALPTSARALVVDGSIGVRGT